MAAPARLTTPSHVYAAAGTYTVTLTVTGPGGSNTQTRTNYVTASPPAPVAQFTGSPIGGTAPLTVNFSNTSTGSITAYAWTFGDGGTSAVATPSHVYLNPGNVHRGPHGHRSGRQQHANAKQLCLSGLAAGCRPVSEDRWGSATALPLPAGLQLRSRSRCADPVRRGRRRAAAWATSAPAASRA